MAKITRYTKDTAGQYLLSIAAVVVIVWLAIAGLNVSYPPGSAGQAAPGSGAVWYYLGVPLVAALWGLASYDRAPSAFKSRKMAAVILGLQGSAIGFVVWLLLFAARNQEILSRFLLGQ